MATNKPTSENDQSFRDHLLSLLRGGNAHISLDDFVADFPVKAGLIGLPQGQAL